MYRALYLPITRGPHGRYLELRLAPRAEEAT